MVVKSIALVACPDLLCSDGVCSDRAAKIDSLCAKDVYFWYAVRKCGSYTKGPKPTALVVGDLMS
jgi:hypothetical protein